MLETTARIIAVLFVASEPVTARQLAAALEVPEVDVAALMDKLVGKSGVNGLVITNHRDTFRLVTDPQAAPDIKRFLQFEAKADLSRPAMETLAIIAYQGPISKTAVDELRGVSSDAMLRNLMQRGLVIEHGKSAEPGRPMLYAVSQSFLEQTGLSSLDDLPELPQSGALDAS